MAWSTPATWVAGAVLTAAQLNAQLRDNLNAAFSVGVDAWTSYTPTLVQSGAVTKTVTYAKYMKVGRLVVVQASLTCTGAGTGGAVVTIGLPVTAAQAGNMACGTGELFDASSSLLYKATAILATTSTIQLRATNTTVANVLGVDAFTAALASSDVITYSVTYESAT